MKTDHDSAPSLCQECRQLIAASGLHWVLCGGLQVGAHRQPQVWLLKPKDDRARAKQRADDMRKMAALARENHTLRNALQRIVDEAESDGGLTAWDGSDIAKEALQNERA
jgi:hypothetical protein